MKKNPFSAIVLVFLLIVLISCRKENTLVQDSTNLDSKISNSMSEQGYQISKVNWLLVVAADATGAGLGAQFGAQIGVVTGQPWAAGVGALSLGVFFSASAAQVGWNSYSSAPIYNEQSMSYYKPNEASIYVRNIGWAHNEVINGLYSETELTDSVGNITSYDEFLDFINYKLGSLNSNLINADSVNAIINNTAFRESFYQYCSPIQTNEFDIYENVNHIEFDNPEFCRALILNFISSPFEDIDDKILEAKQIVTDISLNTNLSSNDKNTLHSFFITFVNSGLFWGRFVVE